MKRLGTGCFVLSLHQDLLQFDLLQFDQTSSSHPQSPFQAGFGFLEDFGSDIWTDAKPCNSQHSQAHKERQDASDGIKFGFAAAVVPDKMTDIGFGSACIAAMNGKIVL